MTVPYIPPTFEQIYAALFSKLSASAPFVTVSRRLRHYSEVPSELQPALFLAAGRFEPRIKAPGMPYKWQIFTKVWLYANAGADDTVIPSSLLNPLINAVLAVLAPATPGDRQTLGGLVYHCYVSGVINTDEGLLGPQAVAVIPVDILTGEV